LALSSHVFMGWASLSDVSVTSNGESGRRAWPMIKSLSTLSLSKSKLTNTRFLGILRPLRREWCSLFAAWPNIGQGGASRYGMAIRIAMAPRNGASDCTGVAAGPPSAAAARGRVYGAKLALAAASARIGLHPSGVPAMGVPRSEHPDLAGVVSRNPEVHSGDLVFAGTRVLVQTLIDYLEGGDPV